MLANLENSAVAKALENVFLFQFQTRVMPKDVETTIQLHSFQMEVKLYSKSFNPGFHSI